MKDKNDKKKKRVKSGLDRFLDFLLALFILTFIGSAGYLAFYYYNINKSQKMAGKLEELIEYGPVPETTDDYVYNPPVLDDDGNVLDPGGLSYTEVNGKMVLSMYAKLYEMNSDFIGWLTIPDTGISYPVMYTPNDEEYYLRRGFDKEYSNAGTLFASKESKIAVPSDNIVIYGHNMQAGTMFHGLLDYQKEDFYKQHKTIIFNTIYEPAEYEVIAAFRTNIKEVDDEGFKYYQFFNAAEPADFDSYVENCQALTPYDTDSTATYGDKLITLSTCSYHTNEGRYVVVAKKVN